MSDAYHIQGLEIRPSDVIQFINKSSIMPSRKVKGAIRGQLPTIKSHEILNFKDVKKLSFSKIDLDKVKFNWGNAHKFFTFNTGELVGFDAFYRSQYEWDSVEYFYHKNHGFLPLTYRIEKKRFDTSFITNFFTYFNPPVEALRAIENYGDKDLHLKEFTLLIEDDLILEYDTEDLSFYINPEKHLVANDSNPLYVILQLISGFRKGGSDKNKIHVVYKGDYGFEKMAFDVKRKKVDIDLNYNDDFKEVSEHIIKSLNNKKKTGLYLLNGEPGTGKTTFIRYLASKLNRNIIFISPDMVDHITDPSFIPFLMNNGDSVLIIEDAEPALQKRDGSARHGAISNILNLTDGLLSDCLNISIVATFNTKQRIIDDALLREGRLLKSYTFEKLAANKAQTLLKKLGHDVEVNKDMTLSEIYFYGEDNKKGVYGKSQPMGFGNR
jgi:hypothetical protein